MKNIKEEMQVALWKVAEDMKKLYNRKRGEQIKYKIGDQVFVETNSLTSGRPTKKSLEKRFGPVKILTKVGASTYKLDLPKTWRVHPIFNKVLLTKYNEPQYPSQKRPTS